MLILLLALWTGLALWRHKIFYGALGIVLFATTAAFATVRFGFGLDNENLITMHRFCRSVWRVYWSNLAHPPAYDRCEYRTKMAFVVSGIAGPAILLALFLPSTRVTLFLIWLLGFVVLCATRTPQIAL